MPTKKKKHRGVFRGRSKPGDAPEPKAIYCRPTAHPLWPSFVSWVTTGPLAKDIVNDDFRFDRDGRIMWLTFLEGARVVYDYYKINGKTEEKKPVVASCSNGEPVPVQVS